MRSKVRRIFPDFGDHAGQKIEVLGGTRFEALVLGHDGRFWSDFLHGLTGQRLTRRREDAEKGPVFEGQRRLADSRAVGFLDSLEMLCDFA
jgi:hypothetical protein